MKVWKMTGRMLFFLLVCMIGWKVGYSTASASSAKVSIRTESSTIQKGDFFYVIITITSSEEMSGFEGYFTYNQSVMKFITGGSVSSGNDDVFSISDTERENASNTLKYSVKFKARKSGSSTIELKSPYGVYTSEDSTNMSVASNALSLSVVKKNSQNQENSSQKPELKSSEKPGENGQQPEAPPLSDSSQPPQQSGLPDVSGLPGSPELPDQIQEPENAQLSDIQPAEQKKGTVYAVILMIAISGLFIIGVLAVILYRERKLETESFFETEEDRMENIADRELGNNGEWENSDGWESNEDMSDLTEESRDTEDIEEIERRLEKKRRWLNIDDRKH